MRGASYGQLLSCALVALLAACSGGVGGASAKSAPTTSGTLNEAYLHYGSCYNAVVPPIESFIRDAYASGSSGTNQADNLAINRLSTQFGFNSPEYQAAGSVVTESSQYLFQVDESTAITKADATIDQRCRAAYG